MAIFGHISMLVSRFSDAIFAISSLRANEIATRFRVSRDRVYVWPSTVDIHLFDPKHYVEERAEVRKKLGIGDEQILLMYHGELSHERGLYQLIRSICLVRNHTDRVRLLLLGKGEAAQKLRELSNSLGLHDLVTFHDSVSQVLVPKFISAADAGIIPLPNHPQWRSQVPTKLLEYLAMKKPVIVTNIAGHRLIVGGRGFVYFCGQGRPDQIAEAVLRYVNAVRDTTFEGADKIVGRFSSDSIAYNVLRVLANRMS